MSAARVLDAASAQPPEDIVRDSVAALVNKLGVDAPRSVGSPRCVMEIPDDVQQHRMAHPNAPPAAASSSSSPTPKPPAPDSSLPWLWRCLVRGWS